MKKSIGLFFLALYSINSFPMVVPRLEKDDLDGLVGFSFLQEQSFEATKCIPSVEEILNKYLIFKEHIDKNNYFKRSSKDK
jgi:hypothetical protein